MRPTRFVPASCCLKVDVDTFVGMRDGVPRLLEAFRAAAVKATFFLSFGPDNSGKAIFNLMRRRGFARKMLRTRAPWLYPLRTLLSGTVLPAPLVACSFPDLVKRIRDEGHEVGVHAWDHRLWQDRLDELDREQIAAQFAQAFAAFESILGERPRSVAAPAWYATPLSLEVQDGLDLAYASDTRGGPPCSIEWNGRRYRTLQVPTTQPCLEELMRFWNCDPSLYVGSVLEAVGEVPALVVPLHAEVEGGRHQAFLGALLSRIRARGLASMTLLALAERCRARPDSVPLSSVGLSPIAGRSGDVLVTSQPRQPASEPRERQQLAPGSKGCSAMPTAAPPEAAAAGS